MAAEAQKTTEPQKPHFLSVSKQFRNDWIGVDIAPIGILDSSIVSACELKTPYMKSGKCFAFPPPGVNGQDPYYCTIHCGFDKKYSPEVRAFVAEAIKDIQPGDLRFGDVYCAPSKSNPTQLRFIADVICPKLQVISDTIVDICNQSYKIPLHVTLRIIECVKTRPDLKSEPLSSGDVVNTGAVVSGGSD